MCNSLNIALNRLRGGSVPETHIVFKRLLQMRQIYFFLATMEASLLTVKEMIP